MGRPQREKRQVNRQRRAARKKMLLTVCTYIRQFFDFVIDFLFGLYYNGKEESIRPVNKSFLQKSAVSIASDIRNKRLKCEDVVLGYIERITEVNDTLKAVTDERFEEALEEAKQIDQDIEAGKYSEEYFEKKPFLGVPFTTKESTACKGMLHTFGLLSRKNVRAEEDADVIKSMKQSGAILIAVTNIPELNLWQESRNHLFGQTCNPYKTTRTTGGSSGGEASMIAACGTGFGIGTDIGGSIRMPAYYCGIFGHKPTSYLISTKGLTRRTGTEKHTMVVAGPMARHAEDLAPLLKVLVGPKSQQLNLDANVDIRKLNYFYVEENGDVRCSSVCSELQALMKRVVNHFNDVLVDTEKTVEKLQLEEFKWSSKLWRYWMTQEPCDFPLELGNREKEVKGIPEFCKKLVGQSDFTLAAIICLLDKMLPQEKEIWAKETTQALKQKLMELLGDNGILIYHSYTWPASYHYSAFLRPYNFAYWAIFNVLQFPVTQVPLGLSADGLPMGLQIVSTPYNDHLCIAVAKYLEKQFGGYVPPFPSVKT